MYSTISEIPEEIRTVIDSQYKDIKKLRKSLERANASLTELENKIKTSVGTLASTPFHLDEEHVLDTFEENCNQIRRSVSLLRNKRAVVDRLTREVEDYEDYIELYMKDNGFDMDSQDIDKKLYEYIHRADRNWA